METLIFAFALSLIVVLASTDAFFAFFSLDKVPRAFL
jgi:hypothetical protein